MSPFYLSICVATVSLFIVMILGILVNYLMHRLPWRIMVLVDAILTLPLVLPPVVIGFALLMLFSPGYALGAWLESHGVRVVFSLLGAILASAVISFPLFYQSLRSALEAVDHDMEDVARTLGASEGRIFLTISLPLAWRGLLAGAILSFCRAMGEFGATILIAGNIPGLTRTMPLAIYTYAEAGQYGEAFDLVVYICILTLSLLFGIRMLTHNVKGQGQRRSS